MKKEDLGSGKYATHVRPYLSVIRAWRRTGVSAHKIATKLKVGKNTFDKYVAEHPKLAEAMSLCKEMADMTVEDSLFKTANGYFVEEQKAMKVKNDGIEEIIITKTNKWIVPNVKAIEFWLTNRAHTKWKSRGEMMAEVVMPDNNINKILDMMKEANKVDVDPVQEIKEFHKET